MIDCDVCVIGAGLAGLSAGVRAAEQGLRVVVLERAPEQDYLCNSRMTGGSFHICLTDILSDADLLEEKILKVTAGAAHPGLARAVALDGRRAVKWLQTQGIRFIRASPEPHHNFVLAPPSLQRVGADWKGRGGDVLLRTLESKLTKHGGKLLRGHRAQELLIDGTCCSGVRGQSDGVPFELSAENIVIADGGFQCNLSLVRDNISPAPEKLLQRNASSGYGDGVLMAKSAGAALSSLVGFYGHIMNRDAMRNAKLWPTPWLDNIATAAIVVGSDGRRFADEGRGGVYIANRIAALEDPLSAFVIFDQAIWDGPGKSRFMGANPHMEQQGGTLIRADSIGELATKLSLPENALSNTVKEYNASLVSQTSTSLSPGRTTQTYEAMPIQNGAFFGVPVCAGVTYTMGGIAIDEWSRARREDGSPIIGLYAAGGSSGGLEGGEEIGYIGGLIKAVTTGIRAGEHIIQRSKQPA